ncbi:MAG: hypothetical protein ABSG25_14290 [Bryobacteraceae bacterium]|jgi:hypothetical protein
MTPEEKENCWRKHEATLPTDELRNVFQRNDERRRRAAVTDEPEKEEEKNEQ